MKTIYLDCGMGAAGDMLTGALIELIPNPDQFIEKLNNIGIPHVKITKEKAEKCLIGGTHIDVSVNGKDESEIHSHHHHHDHEHHHGSMNEIEHIIEHLDISQKVQNDIISVYNIIAQAESEVHGVPVTDIHFHEVGTMDAIADITAVCLLMEELSPEKVMVSPVHVGSGSVQCAHGILPVPAPATAIILKGIPIYGGKIDGELCTPTGAALLKYFADSFGDMPVIRADKIGYGMGKKDFPKANCVRAMLGETDGGGEEILELSCNVDDMTGEEMGFACEMLFSTGAKDVFTIPTGMKKSRPGLLLKVICTKEDKEKIVEAVFKYTTTIGIRETSCNRYTLERKIENIETPFGQLRQKISTGFSVTRKKFEYDDLARIAKEKNLSIDEVLSIIEDK